MIKWLRYLLFVGLILACLLPTQAKADGNTFVGIAVNDRLISFPDALPEARDGVTYVPVRVLADAMRATIVWDAATQQIVIDKFHKVITLDTINNRALTDKHQALPCPMFIKGGRVMVPYRVVSSLLGYGVSFIPEGPLARATIDLESTLGDEQLLSTFAADLAQQKEEAFKREPPPPPKPKSDKVAYLTFDDGPGKYTAAILDVLDQYKVHGTFFMLEPAILNNPAVVKRMVEEGHGVGLHGSTHRANLVYASPQASLDEFNRCNQALYSVAGVWSNLIRAPYGSKPLFGQSFRDLAAKTGYHLWDWNVDSADSRSASVPVASIIETTTQYAAKQKKAVILMHDRKTSVDALPAIIEFLQKNDYAIEALSGDTKPVNFWGDER